MILDEFQTPGKHLTADLVYQHVRRRIPNISLGTVYRNLEILSKAGVIRKLRLGCEQKQYDGGLHDHYHVRCVQCGSIKDVPIDLFGNIESAARQSSDFEILSHQLEFEGLCPECQAADGLGDPG